jgi:hypothetical protein
MRGSWLSVLGGLLGLALLAGALAVAVVAWAGMYPRSPALARASTWPVVGPWIAEVRARHLGPAAERTGPRVLRVVRGTHVPALDTYDPAPIVISVSSVPLPDGVWPEVWLRPGDELRSQPSARSASVATVSTVANVRVLEARGDWRRVFWHTEEGWVREQPGREPPLGSAPDPVLPLTGRAARPELLAAAREILGLPADAMPAERLGAYPLFTDVNDAALKIVLDRAARGVDDAYRARYGLSLVGNPAETVVVFRRRADYEAYLARTGGPAAETGHVAGGVVALYREGRLIDDVRATLVHELVHVLGRRGLGPALPPWLDEGMADDLAESTFGEGGRPIPGTLSDPALRTPGFVEIHGGHASLDMLRRQIAGPGLVPLAELTSLGEEEFLARSPRGLTYAESSFFIRYLLASGHAPSFRSFLHGVASGRPPSPDALVAEMGTSWSDLDAGLAAYVALQPAGATAEPSAPTATATAPGLESPAPPGPG